MTPEQREEFIDHMRNGMRRGAAAGVLGLSRASVLEEIAEDEDFNAQVLEAEGEATEHVMEALYQAAVSGSVAACKLWLQNQQPSGGNLPVLFEGGGDDFEELMRMSSE